MALFSINSPRQHQFRATVLPGFPFKTQLLRYLQARPRCVKIETIVNVTSQHGFNTHLPPDQSAPSSFAGSSRSFHLAHHSFLPFLSPLRAPAAAPAASADQVVFDDVEY